MRFPRATHRNIYVKSARAGERVFASVTRFLSRQLKLVVSKAKRAVDRPWRRTFLGFSFTRHHLHRRRVSEKALKRLKMRYANRQAGRVGWHLRESSATCGAISKDGTLILALRKYSRRCRRWIPGYGGDSVATGGSNGAGAGSENSETAE